MMTPGSGAFGSAKVDFNANAKVLRPENRKRAKTITVSV